MPMKYRSSLGIKDIVAAIGVIIFFCPTHVMALQESSVVIGGAEFQFITIQPGTFTMGSGSGDGDERPVHKVSIDYGFDIGTTEVTVRQFRAFIEATGYETDAQRCGGAMVCPGPDRAGYARETNWQNPGFEQTDLHPVVCISYSDAKAFCKWFSGQDGRICRLPVKSQGGKARCEKESPR